MKIAILLLNNNGDILYATPIAKQIKEIDFPGAQITWIVAKQCSDILKYNNYVDNLDIIEISNSDIDYVNKWIVIRNSYLKKVDKGEFDKLFVLQGIQENLINYKTSIRQMILDSYPNRIKVSIQPLVFLSSVEVSNVKNFVVENEIHTYKNKILIEFAPNSGQANLNIEQIIKMAEEIVELNPSTCIILSSNMDLPKKNNKVFSAKALSFKENAELINYCSLLVGCSSGISWLSTSSWCKPIPIIQFLKTDVPWFNSLKSDFGKSNLDSSKVIELYKYDIEHLTKCISYTLQNDFESSKRKYDQFLQQSYFIGNFKTISEILYHTTSLQLLLKFFFKNLGQGFDFIKHTAIFIKLASLHKLRTIRSKELQMYNF